jgi:hypothetical protein
VFAGQDSSLILGDSVETWEMYMNDQLNFSYGSSPTTVMTLHRTSNNATIAGNLIIGTAGKGIDFSAQTPTSASGASNVAEILDHYEEGTWTPVMDVSSGSAIGYSVQLGRYTKIGDIVYASFSLNVNSGQANQNSNLSGLPFASANVTNVKHAGSFCEVDTNFCNSAIAIATIDANASLIQLRKSGGTNNEPSDLFTVNQTGEIIGNIVYKAG